MIYRQTPAGQREWELGCSRAWLAMQVEAHQAVRFIVITKRALKHQSPIQALRKWQLEKPEMFANSIEKLP